MRIRLGYACLSKTLVNITSSKTITYTTYINKKYDEKKINDKIFENLDSLKKIIEYNISNNIHFYRLTSNLIPLATHNDINIDYIRPFKEKFKEIGNLISKSNMRVDLHPNWFAILNSTNKDVVNNTYNILKYHYNILDALNIKDKVIILHIGSSVCGKKASLTRFINNFNKLPINIRDSIVLENDDKIYNALDTLNLCNKLNIPMVLDYHHHMCNNNSNIDNYLENIFNTWTNKTPKIHFSSPKSKLKKEYRSHSNYINSDDFIMFIEKLKKIDKDVDIMLEAKDKDDALFKLVRELKYKTNYKFIDETTFIV